MSELMTGGGAYTIITMGCWVYSIGIVIGDILLSIINIFVTIITMILAIVGTLVQVIVPGLRYLPCTNLSPFSLSWLFPLGQPLPFSSFLASPIQPFTTSISPFGTWAFTFPTITKNQIFTAILVTIVMILGWILFLIWGSITSSSAPIKVENQHSLDATLTFISEMRKLDDIYRQKLHLMNLKHKKKMTWDEFKDPIPYSVTQTTPFVNDTDWNDPIIRVKGLFDPLGQFYMSVTIFIYIMITLVVFFVIGACCRVLESVNETVHLEPPQTTQNTQNEPSLFSLLATMPHHQKKKLKPLPPKKSLATVIETPKTNKILKEHLECTLCYENIRNAALMCGHVGCQACLEKVRKGVDGAKCPWCREPFVTYIKLYV